MKYSILPVIFIIMIMSGKMFLILGAFLFGYNIRYYLFEILKYKNNKDEIHQFFLSYNKQYGSSYRSNYEKNRRN